MRDQAPISFRNTSTEAILFELYALFNSQEEIDPMVIKEAIFGDDRLHKNSYEMRRKVGKQTQYIERPSIALITENIEEHLFGDINDFHAQQTGSTLGYGRPLGSFANARCTIR